MIRFLLRALSLLAFAAAVAAAVVDGTRSIAAGEVLLTSLGQTCLMLFPTKFPGLQPLVERNIHPMLWDPVLNHAFLAPTWGVLALLGLFLIWISQPKEPPIGYSSRP